MDKITALIPQVREANAWDALSNEEVIERALLESLCCASGYYDCPVPVVEFISFDDSPDG